MTPNQLLGIVVAGALMAAQPVAAAPSTLTEALDLWGTVLAHFVDEQGRTDFDALSANRAALDEFVAYVARVSPVTSPQRFPSRAEVLAYHLNAYNALAMQGILDAGVTEGFSSIFRRAAFFRFREVSVGGNTTSLSAYENDVIRPLGEPRVHFALNCMVRDCPRLPREPYRPDRLDAQLEAATREFLNEPKHVRVDTAKREIWLSEILDFYTEDFVADGKRQSLIPYINRYRDEPVDPSLRVKFMPYDWTLNRQP